MPTIVLQQQETYYQVSASWYNGVMAWIMVLLLAGFVLLAITCALARRVQAVEQERDTLKATLAQMRRMQQTFQVTQQGIDLAVAQYLHGVAHSLGNYLQQDHRR